MSPSGRQGFGLPYRTDSLRRWSTILCAACFVNPITVVAADAAAREPSEQEPVVVEKSSSGRDGGRSLPAVVVTGTRTEKDVDQAPVRTEVIDQQEIRRTGAITLKDALENVPGLHLTDVHGKSGFQLSLQGFTGDQVLVLIDGLPLTSSTGSTTDLGQYLLAAVDRIEVVKGPASALYGSAAMGGVVNVITRPIRPGWSGRIEGDIGTRAHQNASGRRLDAAVRHLLVATEGGSERWRWRVAGDGLRDGGFSENPDAWPLRGDRIERRQFVGRGEWLPLAGIRLFVEGSTYREDDEQRYDLLVPPRRVPQRKTEDIFRDRWVFGTETRIRDWRARAALVDERYRSESIESSNGVAVNRRDADLDLRHLSLQLDAPPWHRQLWQVGADWRHDRLGQGVNGVSEVDSATGVTRESHELYAQNNWLYSDAGELIAGLRWQRDSDFGDHAVPRLGIRQQLRRIGDWGVTLRASVGQGYRVPNLKERHFLFDHSSLGYVVLGNPDLRPERSTGSQIGLTLARDERVSLDVNAFHHRISDLIQVDTGSSDFLFGVPAFRYRNVSRARATGLETGVRWRQRPGLDWRAAYTRTRTRDLDTGLELTRRPRDILRVGVDWLASERTTVAVRWRWQSDELVDSASQGRSPSWSSLDVIVQRALDGNLVAIAGVRNLFDRQRDFADPNDLSPREGRLVWLGLRYAFGGSPSATVERFLR